MALNFRCGGLGVLVAAMTSQFTVGQECTSVSPASTNDVTAAVTSQVNAGLCKQNPDMTEDTMRQQCSDFCSIGGQQISLPLLMGSTSFGFNQEEFDAVCLNTNGDSILTKDEALKATCKANGQSIRNIEDKAADFVAVVDLVKGEQLIVAAKMEKKTVDLQTFLTSQEFKDEMDAAIDKEGLLKVKFKEWKNSMSDSGTELNEAMNQLKDAGFVLKEAVDTNLAAFTSFLRDCGVLLAASSAEDHYLLDICKQGNAACLENPGALHVACCCAINPLALGLTYEVDGLQGASLSSMSLAI